MPEFLYAKILNKTQLVNYHEAVTFSFIVIRSACTYTLLQRLMWLYHVRNCEFRTVPFTYVMCLKPSYQIMY